MAYIVAGLIATGSNAFSTGGAQNNSAVTLPGPDAAFATTGLDGPSPAADSNIDSDEELTQLDPALSGMPVRRCFQIFVFPTLTPCN